MNILLTGGAGYIGSHTYCALVEAGYTPVILDNFSNSHPAVLERLSLISGSHVICEVGDVSERSVVENVIKTRRISAVIHFAAFKSIGESVSNPLLYYRNNLGGLINLLEAMEAATCRALVYSSSATVYGDPAMVPITEDLPRTHTNPYGHTKVVSEDMLAALRIAKPDWRIGVLRYFNPVGAHTSGLIGESPNGVPNNLMPYVSQVAVGERACLNVYGNDYPTPDGTGIRDYIHVVDLAEGHVAALKVLLQSGESFTVNLGTGQGYSVLDVVRTFEEVSGQTVPIRIAARRSGDVAKCYADPSNAHRILGWRARKSLIDMCSDAWRWQKHNPNGYLTETQ
jgi:UDP-glucose 4-epimerase